MRSAAVKRMMKKSKSVVKMNKIHKFYDKWINSNSGFSRFELYLKHPFHFKHKRYFYLNIIPVVAFDFDKQFNDTFHYHDDKLHESEVGIGIMIEWLGFKLNFQVNFRTNKPEIKEEE